LAARSVSKENELDIQGIRHDVEQVAEPAENSSLGAPWDVRVLDNFQNTASLKVDMDVNVDCLHVAKWNGQWKIVSVLWALRPSALPK
jgi:Putative lumazine-binding